MKDRANPIYWIGSKVRFSSGQMELSCLPLYPPKNCNFWGIADPGNDMKGVYSKKGGLGETASLVWVQPIESCYVYKHKSRNEIISMKHKETYLQS